MKEKGVKPSRDVSSSLEEDSGQHKIYLQFLCDTEHDHLCNEGKDPGQLVPPPQVQKFSSAAEASPGTSKGTAAAAATEPCSPPTATTAGSSISSLQQHTNNVLDCNLCLLSQQNRCHFKGLKCAMSRIQI